MRHGPATTIVLCTLILIGVDTWAPGARADEEAGNQSAAVHWHTDLAEARAVAEKDGKPLYVLFRCIP